MREDVGCVKCGVCACRKDIGADVATTIVMIVLG